MTKRFGRENGLTEKMHPVSTFQQLSETELLQLLHSILTLQKEFQRVPPFDDEFVEEVTSTQGILSKWRDVLECLFAVKQRKTIHDQLCTWDNEGGKVPPSCLDELETSNRVLV